MNDRILEIIKAEYQQRVITESLSRITQCLDSLSYQELWHRENKNTNATGNIILHLSGNITQYIIAGVGETEDVRLRDEEFSVKRSETKEELKSIIADTLNTSNKVVQSLPCERFLEEVTIQGFQHTRLSAILHVIEHLSYHVGQITYYTKFIKNIDTAYYGGMDLDVVG